MSKQASAEAVGDLKIEYRPVVSLTAYARNPRTHSDAQVDQIVRSIREFGWTNPVLVDGESGVIAGHGRILAAQKLGISLVPCIELSGLTEAQKRAYIIADNKLALNAGWNDDLLKLELLDLKALNFDLDVLAFDGSELSEIMYGPQFGPVGEDEQGRLDQKSPITCPGCGLEFIP